jgi:hypothetical protein
MRPGNESRSLRVKMPVPDAILNKICYRYSNDGTKIVSYSIILYGPCPGSFERMRPNVSFGYDGRALKSEIEHESTLQCAGFVPIVQLIRPSSKSILGYWMNCRRHVARGKLQKKFRPPVIPRPKTDSRSAHTKSDNKSVIN